VARPWKGLGFVSSLRRRALAGVVATLTGCLLVSACTTDGGAPEASPSPSASAPSPEESASADPAEPVTLRLAVYGGAAVRRSFDEMATAFTAAHPQVDVVVEKFRTAEEAQQELERGIATGDAPDVFVASNEQVAGLATADQVLPVDQLLEERGIEFGDNYQRLGLEAFSAEQALQCMPYDVSPMVVFYHPGLVPFRRLIEPGEEPLTPETGWTWQQFAKAARLMSRDGVKGAYVPPELSTLMALVRSAGDDIVDDPREATTLTMADDGTRAALEEILSVVRDKRITPTEQQLARRDGFHRFTHEQVGMMLGTKAMVPKLRQVEGLDFDVFPLPRLARAETVADVSALCLSSDSAHVEAAADLIAFASQDEGARILAGSGAIVPAHLPTLNSDSFTEPGTAPSSVLVFDEAVRRSTTSPFVTAWPNLEEHMAPEIAGMFYDPLLDLDTLLPRLDMESQRIMAPVTEPTDQ
jgi:multiple sugar transport system substrate-binding protein